MAVLYTSNEVVGEVMGEAEFNPVNATLGIKIPLFVDVTSSCEELDGVFVPMPTCALHAKTTIKVDAKNEITFFKGLKVLKLQN